MSGRRPRAARVAPRRRSGAGRHAAAGRPPARGQGLAEYALILALIALFVLAGLLLLGIGFGTSVSLASPTPTSPASPGPTLSVG